MLVVSGASGLLGANVLRLARQAGWDKDVVGLCHRHVIRDPALRIARVDLTDSSATRNLFSELFSERLSERLSENRPNAILHCAAAADVDWCEANPKQAEAINVGASAVLAEIAALFDARFIYISTDSVFDGKRGGYVEIDQPAPVNVYARSKLAAEREIQSRNPMSTIVRVNIYGWNAQNKESLAERILSRLEEGRDVPGFTDVCFNPLLANDLAVILFAMLQRELTGLYHVVGSERITKFEFARRVAATFGFDPARITPCQVKDMNLKAERPLDVSLNTEKIGRALGRSMPTVDSGLRAFRELRDRGYSQQLKSYLYEGDRGQP
jgi:dTDP-4-dehydrorhamnose reductase